MEQHESALLFLMLPLVNHTLSWPADLLGATINGTLPVAWANLTALQSLSLSLNTPGSFGSLPSVWSALSALQRLRLSNASLVGTLPGSWGSLGNLTTLVLSNVTGLSGGLPATWVSGLGNLTTFHLRAVRGVNVTSTDLTALLASNRTSGGLQSLALDGFNISGPIPALNSRWVHIVACGLCTYVKTRPMMHHDILRRRCRHQQQPEVIPMTPDLQTYVA